MLHPLTNSGSPTELTRVDAGLDSISRLTTSYCKDFHFSTYAPYCLQCIGTICKWRHGGPRDTTPVSTPTAQPSNSPNPHQGQYIHTNSRLPYPLPQTISIPTTGSKHPGLGRAPNWGTKPFGPGVSPHIQNKPYQLWRSPTMAGTSADTPTSGNTG